MILHWQSLIPWPKRWKLLCKPEFKTAMIRYVNDRFIDVELVVSEKPVLKFRIRQLQKTVLYGSKRVFYTGRRFLCSRTYDRKPCWRYRFGNTGSANHILRNGWFYYIDDETVSAGDVVVKTILPGRIPSAVMWTSSPVFIISTKDMPYLNKLIFLHKTINIPSLIQALPTESPCMIILP